MANVDQRVFSLMHTQLVPDLADDVYYEFLGYHQHVEGWGGVGASLIFLTYGKSIATDEQGNERGTFSSYELSPSLSLGTELAKGLSAGITLKYVYVNLAPKEFTLDGQAGTGDTFAADLGALYELSFLDTRIGVNVQNLGPEISFIDEDQSDPIGRNLKTGIGFTAFETGSFRTLLEGDINKSLSTRTRSRSGTGHRAELQHLCSPPCRLHQRRRWRHPGSDIRLRHPGECAGIRFCERAAGAGLGSCQQVLAELPVLESDGPPI